MAPMVLAYKAGTRVLLEPVQSGASTTGERDETMAMKPTEITCPNKHKVRTSKLYRVEKSVKKPDMGKVQCPICLSKWCYCPKHGEYGCPPPCPWC